MNDNKETVKVIIEIPKETYEYYTTHCDGYVLPEAIKNGIPLEDIKAEIKEHRDSWEKDGYYDEADALNIALKIIDKHIGNVESEDI